MNATQRRLADCQRVIGYYFSIQELLEIALTHSSLRAPDRECNERLEFLGDSILGLVITEELYHLLPDQSEGDLTRIKSAVVSRTALLATSQRLNLSKYAEFARGVGRRDTLPASVVANLVEAVIGAIYLDAGYYPAREFVLRHMSEAIDDELNDRGAKNYKSLLQHEVQQAVGLTPTYRTIEAEGPDHAKQFIVAAIIRGQEWGRAGGQTKKDAEQDAARLALEAWGRRGRGRRRRRGRRGTGAGAAESTDTRAPAETRAEETPGAAPEPLPSEAAETHESAPKKTRPRRRGRRTREKVGAEPAAQAAVTEAAPAAEIEEAAPVQAAPAAEEPARRPRRRRRRRGADATPAERAPAAEVEAASSEAASPVVESPEAASPEAVPAEAAPDAGEPARRPRRRRRRGADAPPADAPADASAADAGPAEVPAETPATTEPAESEPAESEPQAPAEPEKKPKKQARAPFGAGIAPSGDDAPKKRAPRKRAAAKKSAKVKAPARKRAPVKKAKPKRASGGFGAGICDD